MMSLAALFILLAALIGTTAMVGVFAFLFHRVRRIEDGREAGPYRLAEQVQRLEEELLSVQTEMSALSERLDFTEKLLMSGDDEAASDGRE
jgi:hypothetical protein